ncbi:MAG TPA: serine hydrolase domain-containing protein [Vicinamibacteria bacterium]
MLRARTTFVPRKPPAIGALAALTLLLLCPGGVRAQGGDFTDERALPAGKRGERVRQTLEAVNSGEDALRRALVAEAFAPSFRDAFPIGGHLDVLGGVHDRSRGLDFVAVRTYAEPGPAERVTVIARSRLTESYTGVLFDFDAEDRIAGLRFVGARPPKDAAANSPLTVEAAARELEAFLDRLAQAGVFSGSVLLAKDGKVVFQGARGLADRNHSVPNRVDTKFNLGSMNKMFTAVVTARLVERGTLSFDDPVSRWLAGEGWTKADLSKVTVGQLLTHTSGLGSYFNDTWARASRQLYRKVSDWKPLVAEETLAFEPGTQWAYSNTGMLIAGAVLEKAAGRDYFDLVRQELYGPTGMKDTDCYDIDLVVPNLAIGYSKERAPSPVWRANTFEHVIRGGPAGGGYATAPDLLAFAEALRLGRLVKPETVERLWSPKPASPRYGYGFGLEDGPGGRIAGHSGGFPGISSNLDIFRDKGFVAVVLSNQDGGSEPLEQKMRELVARIR